MELVTLLIAAVGCLLVLFVRPIYGLAVYAILSMWYPYGVGTVSLGTIDFSAGRIVIIVLFVKIFLSTNLTGKFRFIWIDRFVIILFIAEIMAGMVTTELMRLIEYRSGDFFDMALPYFAVRLIVTSKEKYISLLKMIAYAAAVLAIFAVYESLTGHNLLKLGRFLPVPKIRLNYFHRAQVTFRHPIHCGVFFAMTGAVCMGLVKNSGEHKFLYIILVILMLLGSFSSMSSGGQFALIGAFAFIAFYRFRHKWRLAVIGIMLMIVMAEIVSNRNFYDLVDYFAFNRGTAWYRTRLFEVAFFEGGMSGHWLFGYGLADPMWCLKIDMRDHTDMVNQYLLKLARYGLVGFIPFCVVIITAIKRLFKDFWKVTKDSDVWLTWCLAGGLFSLLFAFNSVSLFGPPMTMFFMVLGFCVMVPEALTHNKLPFSTSVDADKVSCH
jgi:hypothetical protein